MQATSGYYWTAAAVTAAIDVFLIAVLFWKLTPDLFRRSRTPFVIIAVLFWIAIYTSAGWGYWGECYGSLYPDWVRALVPVYGLIVGGPIALLFWWAALRLPGNPTLSFTALAGLHSLPGHLWAIYGKDMLDRCPLLIDVDPAPALVFGVFEFIFYWTVILGLAALTATLRDRHLPRPH